MRASRSSGWSVVAVALTVGACNPDTAVSDGGAAPSQWIERAGSIQVRVRTEKGQPLPADIDVRQADGTRPSGFFGFTRLEDIPGGYAAFFDPGEYTVEVRSDGYRPHRVESVQVGRGDHDTMVDVRLTRRRRD